MSDDISPEPIFRAALRVISIAASTTRDWALSDEVSRQQIHDISEAIIEIPELLKRWRNDEEGIRELKGYLQRYDQRWTFPKLENIFLSEFYRLASERLGWFQLASGRNVILEQFKIRKSDIGFLEGRSEWIRAEVLRQLPDEIKEQHGNTGFLLREPPPGHLPDYTFIADLHSNEPIGSSADCSNLVLCWFGYSLPMSVRGFVGSQLETLDWDKYATDGWY